MFQLETIIKMQLLDQKVPKKDDYGEAAYWFLEGRHWEDVRGYSKDQYRNVEQ